MAEKLEITKIVIGDRQREDLGDIESLALSIDRIGLLYPIIVSRRPDTRVDLIAGHRRLLAVERLGWTEVPVLYRDNLDDYQKKELELEENVRRKQLGWLEEARAIRNLDKLKRDKYGSSLPGRFGGKGWSQADTAQELRLSAGKVSQDISLAEAADKHPELNVTTRREALRLLRKIETGLTIPKNEILTRLEESFVSMELAPYLNRIEPATADLLITDICDQNIEDPVVQTSLAQVFERLSFIGHAFVFFRLELINELFSLAEKLKLNTKEQPFIWHIKGEDDFASFLWFSRGMGTPPKHLPKHSSHRRDSLLHNRAKPYILYNVIVENSTSRGALVIDPFSYDPALARVCIDFSRNVLTRCISRVLHEQYILNEKNKQTKE